MYKRQSLNIPLFVTPSYAGLATAKGASSDHVISQLERITTWMNKHPDVRVVLTHGLSWRIFCSGDGLEIPDAVYRAIPVSPYFYLQLLFPISLGDLWEYPMLQVKSTVETLGARIGADHLIWGTDMPIVMRFQTYRQTLEHMYACLSEFSPNDIALVTGGNMTPLRARMDFELAEMSSEFASEMETLVNKEVKAERDIKVSNLSRIEAFKIPDLIRMKIKKNTKHRDKNIFFRNFLSKKNKIIKPKPILAKDIASPVRNTKKKVDDKIKVNKKLYLFDFPNFISINKKSIKKNLDKYAPGILLLKGPVNLK